LGRGLIILFFQSTLSVVMSLLERSFAGEVKGEHLATLFGPGKFLRKTRVGES